MSDARPFSRVAFCGTVKDCLPDAEFRSLARQFSATTHTGPEPGLVVALASELLGRDPLALPNWVDTDTRYLVVLDVPEQAVLRLASRLRLHKPDQRLHVCRDSSVVKRLVIALTRPVPWEGILDAYVHKDSLVVVLGDMSVRKFPVRRLPKVRRFEPAVVRRFVIDSSGSYLHWPDPDVHMGASQMLQAVDPAYLADVEIRRYEMENVSQALLDMRRDGQLKQTEIPGLSERHVRRLEKEEMRLTVEAANKFACALELTLPEFLGELSGRITNLQRSARSNRIADRPAAASVRWSRTRTAPSMQRGERPIKAFVSSVMRPEFAKARKETVRVLEEIPLLVRWAFEYTPGSSESVDKAYLRHVRDADFVIWLVTGPTTQAVSDEVKEAIAASRKLWIVIIDPNDKWATETKSLIDHARNYAKWIEPNRCGGLRTALLMTWDDEVIRALRGIPGMGRVAKLESMGSASRARCISRWQAAGVPRAIALQMLARTDVGSAPPELLPTDGLPISLLTGDFGIGKSLAAERALQAAIAAAQEGRARSIPVFVQADELAGPLDAAVRQQAIELGDPRTEGVFLVVDGLEQAGVSDALRILNEIRALVEAWPRTRALVTSRALPVPTPIEEARPLPPLSDQAAHDLITRVSGRAVTPALAHGWPSPVKEAIARPLFAILLGGYLREEARELPRSKGDLISQLVDRSLQATGLHDGQAQPVLARLAVAITQRGGGRIQASEAGDPEALRDLASAGLVLLHDSLVKFPLPILQQWFSARALGEGLVSVSEIARSGAELDRWRYALIIAAGLFDHNRTTNLLAPLARAHPGFVSQIVNEGLAEWGLDDAVPAPPGTDAADRIRQAMDAYVNGLGPIAKLIAPLRHSGDLLPVAARSSGSHVAVGWYRGRDARPAVSELPGDFSIFSAAPEWTMCRWARPGRHSAWAWRWALGTLTTELYNLLDSRRLPAKAVALRREEAWYAALALLGRGDLHPGPIKLEDLKRRLSPIGRSGELSIHGKCYDLDLVWSVVDEATAASYSDLPVPHPGPDRQYGRWIWSAYSDAQLLQRTRSVFQSALEIYESIVTEWFSSFRDRLSTSVILPAMLEGYLRPSQSSKDGFVGPTITWRFRALPVEQTSRVDIRLGTEPWSFDWSESSAEYERLRMLRPGAAAWLHYSEHTSVLNVFGEAPARELAYDWLSDDLARIAWLERRISQRY